MKEYHHQRCSSSQLYRALALVISLKLDCFGSVSLLSFHQHHVLSTEQPTVQFNSSHEFVMIELELTEELKN